jgi:hypothetical protein
LTLFLGSCAQVDMETEALLTRGPLIAPDAVPGHLISECREVASALALLV